MKRIFPIIMILMSLSLLGLIWIQVNWFNTMVIEKREQLLYDVTKAMYLVGDELVSEEGLNGFQQPSLKNALNMEENPLALGITAPPKLSDRFKIEDIRSKLDKEFKKINIKTIQYEVGIQNFNLLDFEMVSKNFINTLADTVNNHPIILTLSPPDGSIYERFGPYENFIVVLPNLQKQILRSIIWMILASLIFSLIILSAFALTIRTMLRQKKLSEIKGDFINNMTHEFKTPIATISLAVDAMKNEKVLASPEKMAYFTGIIKQENKRMNQHVETILKAALLEKQELDMMLVPLHIHEVISNVASKFELQLSEKNGKIEMNLGATNDLIDADENHFTNLVNNLIDNAVKYGKENVEPLIKISTTNAKNSIHLKIEDNGIGMNRETVKRIFERFYRAHTGNIHNVKGFGLGLSYVKTVMDAHGGKMKVESTIGKGSSFSIELPLHKNVVQK